MKDPAGEWIQEQGDRYLNLDFDDENFNELHNFLDIRLSAVKSDNAETYVDLREKQKNEYLKIAKEKRFEMLGRIWYWYESVVYLPQDIDELIKECMRFKEQAQNPAQLLAADKLLDAATKAFNEKSGLFLASA